MSEQEKSSGVDLGVDGAERESEFNRLEAEAGGVTTGPNQPIHPGSTEPPTSEIIEPILQMGFAVLAPAWQVSDPECKELAKCYGALIDKYFPEGMGQYGVEITAVMTTAAVILPRMKIPRKLEPKPPEQKPAEGSSNEQ
ncbi:MAG: hypothetical protein KME67_03950 [Candidatus Thiodiazotropha sp. (ex Codakia orbicularis)]|nr:hypothetical protein [Candidatus Thiodiazotropha sp. (ex Codakia orbicularis)]